MRVLWLNGTFGVGKTTTGAMVAEQAGLRPVDPEWVGYLLRAHLSDHAVTDFQQWSSWRRLVPLVLDELAGFTGRDLVAVQTVLVEEYWYELLAGLEALGHEVFHVVLEADEATMLTRIEGDRAEPGAADWRRDHLAHYHAAREWLADAADLVLDTSDLAPSAVVERVLAAYEPANLRNSTDLVD